LLRTRFVFFALAHFTPVPLEVSFKIESAHFIFFSLFF